MCLAPPYEAVPESGINRDYQFRQAGIYVPAHSHVLLAAGFELLSGGLIFPPRIPVGNVALHRTVLKIVMGTHLQKKLLQFTRHGQTEELLTILA